MAFRNSECWHGIPVHPSPPQYGPVDRRVHRSTAMSGYISVLLQKSSADGGWGFLLGAEPPSPNVIVTQVDTRCVASELLEPGDRVIELEGVEANKLSQEEVNWILKNPSNRLSMVLLKRRPSGNRGGFTSYRTTENKREEVSSREEKCNKTESTRDYNYYEVASQNKKNENVQTKKSLSNDGVYQAKPFLHETNKHKGSFETKTKENYSHSYNDNFFSKNEHHSSTKNLREENTSSKLKKEILEMEEKKKVSSTFWTDPPKDLRSSIKNTKFWKSPADSYVRTSTIFNQLNDLHNQQKKINPREEKRMFWENCSKGRLGSDSPGSRSDCGNNERKEEQDTRSRSCEPEHLKPTNPFNGYDNYRTTSPSNPFYCPSPNNPFCEEVKECYSRNGHNSTSGEKYSSISKQDENSSINTNILKENIKVENSEEKNNIKRTEISDFTANREFFERATSVPTTSCVKNAQDLVSERLSPFTHSGLRKPSDFINQIRADTERSKSLQPESAQYPDRREVREKSILREIPKDYSPSIASSGFESSSSVDRDTPRRCFTETSYEKVTRVGTPYENVESAWRREYRVATPSGFYDNSNFEEIFKEESFLEHGHPEGIRKVRTKPGAEEAVDEAFRELTRREGLEPNYGYYYDYTRQSNQIQSNGNSNTAPANGPPPPPPPPNAGNIPAVRIASEVGPRKAYEPPAAIQNAMMTKDKKPFTYTPGGLNLNEIRSPRMARRISRNAHTEDSCTPQAQQAPTSPPGGQPLPPAALAAMQPQIAIPVFPPGSGAPHTLPPPPPPPPPPSGPCPPNSAPPPPALPPPTSPSNKPLDFPPRPEFLSDIASHPPLRPVAQAPRSTLEQQPPEFLADIASHPPLRPVGQPPRSLYEPQPSQIQVQLKPVSPKPGIDQNDAAPIGQIPFVPRPQIEIPVQNAPFTNQSVPPLAQNQMRTPPIQSVKPPVTPPLQLARAPPTPPIQSVRAPPTPPIQPATPPAPSPQPVLNQRQPQTPSTPTLNKSPAPWLTNKTAAKEAQPPWTVRQQSSDSQPPTTPVQQSYLQPSQETGHQPVTRVIPIQIEGRESATPPTPPTPQQQYVQSQQKYVQPQSPQYSNQQQQYQQPSPTFTQVQPQYVQPPQSQQQYGYPQQQYVPPQFQQIGGQIPPQQYMQTQQFPQESQVKTRIIPIQMEGNNDNNLQSQKPIYQNQNSQPGNIQNRNQNGEADPRKFQTQTSWSGNPTQSRSFRVLQKITGSDDEPQAPVQPAPQPEVILVNRVYPAQATEPVSGEYNGWGTNTPPTYPNYWYNPPQTPEEQQQFWDHYNAMCNYMAHMNATAMRYSPYPYPPYPFPYPPYPSDTEDYSNSSSDEMTLYGKMFKEHAQQIQQQALNQSAQPVTPSDATPSDFTETEGEDTSDSDTEVEEKSLNPISSIRSVPNINIYACNSEESSEESESSEEEEEEETEDDSLPHQLSVIYEESDFSSEDGRKSNAKSPYESDNSSTSTLKNKDEDESAVKVRLPLQLKFTRSENDEEVATLIVGNSEMEASKPSDTEESSLIITDIIKEDSDPDITATIVIKKSKPKIVSKEREDSPIDFWKELNGDNPSATVDLRSSEDDSKQEESDFHWEDDSSSTSVQTVKKGVSGNDTSSEAETSGNLEEQEESIANNRKPKSAAVVDERSETDESSEEESEDDKEEGNKKIEKVETEELDTEDDDESDTSSSSSSSEDDSEHSNVFHDNSRQENNTVKKKDLISSKSFEESEDDSGVTSDLSRHISETDTDPECGSELSKMSRYQRAATHSRLFKLLQEQCEAEENAEKLESISQRKERLTLPLSNAGGDDSLSSSSGVNSPSSPTVTDRLVKELIQSLLSRKKGRHFRKLPMEKLHAAALRILQEDTDPYDTVSTSDESNFFLSPVNNHNKANAGTYTDSSLLNPESYGGNYYDYCNYYSTWGTVDSAIEPDYDIVPSKTFKILQGQTQGESTGVKVRCPRVPSSKNLREQLTTPIPSFSSPIPKET